MISAPDNATDRGLPEILNQCVVPAEVVTYLKDVCGISSLQLLLSYVVREQFETEWAEVFKTKFVEKTEGEALFTKEQQRLYITKVRAAYNVTLTAESPIAERMVKKDVDAVQGDIE